MATFTSVQSNNAVSVGGVTSLTITLGAGVTQGSMLVACFGAGNSGFTTTPPDASWHQAGPTGSVSGGAFSQVWYLIVDAGHAGGTSWAFTLSVSHSAALTIREWNSSTGWPASPVDASSSASGTSSPITTGTTGATTQASELAVASLDWQWQSGAVESGLTAGYTSGQGAITSTIANASVREAYQALTGTGTQACQETVSGTVNFTAGVLATFIPAAAGGVPAPGPAPQQGTSLLWPARAQVPQQAAVPSPPPPLPAPSQAPGLLALGLPQSPQSPQVPPPPPPGPAPAQSPSLLARGQATQPQSSAVPGAPAPGPAPQQAASLLRQGLPQSAPSPQAPQPAPPGQQPQAAAGLLLQGLPQAPQYSQLPGPPPPIAQPEQSPLLVQRGTAVPGNFAQAPAVVAAPPPSPAGSGPQGASLLRLALPQQQAAAQAPPPVIPPVIPMPGQQQSPLLIQLGLPVPGNFAQALAVAPPVIAQPGQQQAATLIQLGLPVPGHFGQAPAVAPPVITLPGQQQSVLLLAQGRPVPGNFAQAPAVVVVPPQPAQAQPQALSLLRLGLPWGTAPSGPAFTVGALTASDAPLAALTAATAPGAASGGVLTATTQRTGGPG